MRFASICQQAGEEFLKPLLQELAITFSKTHNLEVLGKLLVPHHASLAAYQHHFKSLSHFAVDYRYPGMHASARQARSALRWAAAIRTEGRRLLGLRPRKP
jgi:HEPN domain-containing protein